MRILCRRSFQASLKDVDVYLPHLGKRVAWNANNCSKNNKSKYFVDGVGFDAVTLAVPYDRAGFYRLRKRWYMRNRASLSKKQRDRFKNPMTGPETAGCFVRYWEKHSLRKDSGVLDSWQYLLINFRPDDLLCLKRTPARNELFLKSLHDLSVWLKSLGIFLSVDVLLDLPVMEQEVAVDLIGIPSKPFLDWAFRPRGSYEIRRYPTSVCFKNKSSQLKIYENLEGDEEAIRAELVLGKRSIECLFKLTRKKIGL